MTAPTASTSLLETDFPVLHTAGYARVRRPASRASSIIRSGLSSHSLATVPDDASEPLLSSRWPRPSGDADMTSMSRIQTSFDHSGTVSRRVGCEAAAVTITRSGSLRRACSHNECGLSQESGGTRFQGPPPILATPPHDLPGPVVMPRHRKHEDDKMSGSALCCLTVLVLLAQVLLHGLVGLVLYWVIRFHTNDGASFPFAWKDDPKREFNLHPVLMIFGFIYCTGQGMLFYRSCRCCRRIWNKLFHTVFHLCAIPCIVIAFIAVFDYHNLRRDINDNPAEPLPHFYSLHAWMGLAAMGLFVLQFVVGFFSFLLLLCCESATASFRANLVPVHSAFGLTTFMLAVATACTGFMEKAIVTLGIAYQKWVPYLHNPHFNASHALAGIFSNDPMYTLHHFEESLVINVLVAVMIALLLLMPVLIMNPKFRFRPGRVNAVISERYG